MFCKKCGKVIPDDSQFCQYCGEHLSIHDSSKIRMWKSPLSLFLSLSRGWQICIMSYIIWVFLWMILCMTDAIYEDEQGIYILIFVFVLPILALFTWYYFAHLRQDSKNRDTNEKTSFKSGISSNGQLYAGYSIYPLLLFAKIFGKMQVKVERDKEGSSFSYCVFTNANGEVTRVGFGSNTSWMTAMDISNNKDSLFVVQSPGSIFTLIHL